MTLNPISVLEQFVDSSNGEFLGLECRNIYWVRHCRSDNVQIAVNHEVYRDRIANTTKLAIRLAVGYYVGTHTKDHSTSTSDCLTCALEGAVKAISTASEIRGWLYGERSFTINCHPEIVIDPLICSDEDREIFEVSALPIPHWCHIHETVKSPYSLKLALITDPYRVWGLFCPESPEELFCAITRGQWLQLPKFDSELKRNMLQELELFKRALVIFVRILVGEVDYKDPHVFDGVEE